MNLNIKQEQKNQQQKQQTKTIKTQISTPSSEKLRLTGAGKKCFMRLLKLGYSEHEARIKAMDPFGTYSRTRSDVRQLTTISNPSSNKMKPNVPLDAREANNVATDPAQTFTPMPAPVQFRKVPVQARLGAPVRRVAPRPPVHVAPECNEDDANEGSEEEDYLNLAILPGDYPNEMWSTEQLEAVQQSIINLVRRECQDTIKPMFSGCTFRKGWLSVSCQNEGTVNWLRDMDISLRPWEGASLRVIPESEVPMRRVFVALLPSLESTSVKYTLRLIGSQNKDLDVYDWHVLHRAQKGPIMKLIISIDYQSVEVLRKKRFVLNYGFCCVRLRPKGKPK